MKFNKYLLLIIFILALFTPQLILRYQNNHQKQKIIEKMPEATLAKNSSQEPGQPEKELIKIPVTPGKPVSIPILMYHEIGEGPDCMWVSEKDFYTQMKYLHDNGYQTISLSQAVELLTGHYDTSKKVALSFDDGYLTFYSHAWPVLKEFDQQATIFVISKLVGNPDYLSWEQIRFLASNGIEVGGHTRIHPLLPTLSAAESDAEITGGKQDIEAQLGKKITTFCYPTGKYNAQIVQQVKASGYVAAVTMEQRKDSSIDNLLIMPRLGVYKNDLLDRFIAVIK
jgi:peptidoglycan/xylan/chitin deacetylase (PgdA/CDA1 family)